MNKEKDMSKEAFNETIDNFEVFGKLTLWGRKNIKYHVKKLQEENDSLKKILDTMGLDANKILYLEKENKELKETLKGTTHCFDEEEHQRLIKENEELKKKLCKKQNVNNLFYRQDLNNPFDKLKYENLANGIAYINSFWTLNQAGERLENHIQRILKKQEDKKK